jgi:hypothetical protein
MNDTLVRLAWALPLVLVLGCAAAWLLRRSMDRLGVGAAPAAPMNLVQTLPLSDGLRAHLIAIGPRNVLVVEGASAPVIQVLPDPPVRARRATPWGGAGA